MTRVLASILMLSFLALPAFATERAESTIPQFREVTPGLYRGGTPGCAGIAEVAQLGVRTVINLDNRVSEQKTEKACAEALGLRWINLAMNAFVPPKDATVNAALAAMADPELRPAFIHCQHGQDRTGLIVGLYRVEHQEWTPQVAYQEMLDIGFRQALIFLDRYFKTRTNF